MATWVAMVDVTTTSDGSFWLQALEMPSRAFIHAVGLHHERCKALLGFLVGALTLGLLTVVLLYEVVTLPLDLAAADRDLRAYQEGVVLAVPAPTTSWGDKKSAGWKPKARPTPQGAQERGTNSTG